MPKLRRLLRLFGNLAALLDGERRRAGAHSGKARQRARIGHALRGRSLRSVAGQDRSCDILLDLRRAAGSLPDLHARRCRMHDGAKEVRIARAYLEYDPEKWAPIFPRDKRGTRLRADHAQTMNRMAMRTEPSRRHAVAASRSSSSSSSIGTKDESGLVDSVIGFLPP